MAVRPPIREGKQIKIRPETHKLLDEIGVRGETFDAVITRLARHYKEKNKK